MNTNLSYIIRRPEDTPHAAVFVVHGMQEHKERYEAFADFLCKRGYAVLLYDLPGHGKSAEDGAQGWFGEKNGWNTLVGSAVTMALLAEKEFPGIPVVCFAHSMGSMIARTFLQNYDFMIDGMILSGAPNYNPGARMGKSLAEGRAHLPGGKKGKGKKDHSRLLDLMATGSFNLSVRKPRTALDWLSYNQENVDRYIEDELCGIPFTVQGYRDLFEGMMRMNDISRYYMLKPQLPILFVAGKDDPCTGGAKGIKNSVNTLKEAGYESVSAIRYPNMRHEILQEKNADEVMYDVTAWLNRLFIGGKTEKG